MRRRFTFKVIPVLAFCSAACGDNAGPLAGASLCADGLWAGIQRQNQGWKTIPATEARVTLSPGEKITLARIGLTDSLQIFFITAEQAQATFPCVSPTKDLSGPIVQGLDFTGSRFGARGLVSIGHSSSFLSQGSGFTLHYVPTGPADLVATRMDVPVKTIIRRGVDYPAGSSIPVLDFGSSEPFALESNTVTVNRGNDFDFSVENRIVTERGTISLLYYANASSGASLTMFSAPESKLTDRELQFLTVYAPNAREAVVFYRHPSDRTVTLGPDASAATRTVIGTAPDLTTRFDMPSQPEYGSQVSFLLCVPQPAPPEVPARIVATKEYFGGTPTSWSVTTPDLKSVDGYPTWGPDARLGGLCMATVSGRPYLLTPQSAHDGDTYLTASPR